MNKNWNGNCQRCFRESSGHTMSWFNEQLICFNCSDEEENHPNYKKAKEVELQEVLKGNYNFEGIGF